MLCKEKLGVGWAQWHAQNKKGLGCGSSQIQAYYGLGMSPTVGPYTQYSKRQKASYKV
jgi:hypothetical protein